MQKQMRGFPRRNLIDWPYESWEFIQDLTSSRFGLQQEASTIRRPTERHLVGVISRKESDIVRGQMEEASVENGSWHMWNLVSMHEGSIGDRVIASAFVAIGSE